MAKRNQNPSGTLFLEPSDPPLAALPTIRRMVSSPCGEPPVSNSSRSASYDALYCALKQLREQFHRIGTFDDANAKLDELCKLLVLKVLDGRHPLANGASRLTRENLEKTAAQKFGSSQRLAAALHDVYADIAVHYPSEINAFGPNRGLNLDPNDNEFAGALIPLLEALPANDVVDERWSFDSLNEAFGHFIQDSFRNRKEDAQYMTPPEVVAAVVDIALFDIAAELDADPQRRILIADPTCGVGSFLAAAFRHASQFKRDRQTLADRIDLFGQDKVERMARLAAVNLKVFAGTNATIRQGNSVIPASAMDDVFGSVDAIFTNPPFGATFTSQEILESAEPRHYPVLHEMARNKILPKAIDSEYALLDREVAMLRPGGRLLMVVPDHVVSGIGFSETFRTLLRKQAHLIGVLDLPSETFAQAGTRTKTSVVYLQRNSSGRASRKHVFMASSDDLGFSVVSRTGATVKKITGTCDLDAIVQAYRTAAKMDHSEETIICLSDKPSVAAVAESELLNNRWTAGFYRTERLTVLRQLRQHERKGFALVPLTELAELYPHAFERVLANNDKNRCISVLHVREDGCVDMQGVASYRPTTPCARCYAGDVLLSKINPRIPRVCVVPDSDFGLGCSTEFAVLRSREEKISAWTLLLLLRSDIVQTQIKTLTSGTSSSHNRIKDKDLSAVIVPIPKRDSVAERNLIERGLQYEAAARSYYDSMDQINKCFEATNDLFGS